MLILASVSGATSANIACLDKIGQDTENFVKPFQDIVGDKGVIGDGPKLQEFINENKGKFYGLIAGNILAHCIGGNYANFNTIADAQSIKIAFSLDNKKYDIMVDTSRLFDYIDLPSAILVVNDRSKNPGDAIEKSQMPTDYFYTSECSDHFVWGNLDDDAPVNKAGQVAFAAYGGSENEFFLDFPVGSSCRAFPGLVLGDFGGWGAEEKIVIYRNYQEGRKAFKTFAQHLNNTQCGNQGLAVYQVSINNKPYTKENGTQGWAIAAGVGGAALSYIGIMSGLTALGMASSTVATIIGSGALYSAITGVAASASVVPVYGWIVAGVLVATAAVIAFVPSELADVPQVVILSEPEIVR